MKYLLAVTLALLSHCTAQKQQYRIQPATMPNIVLTSTNYEYSAPTFKQFDGTVDQIWYLNYLSGDEFTIQSVFSDYYLNCEPASAGTTCRLSNDAASFTSIRSDDATYTRLGAPGTELVVAVESRGNSGPYAALGERIDDQSELFELIPDPRF